MRGSIEAPALLHAEYLLCLDLARHLDAHVLAEELRGCVEPFAARRWIVADGHQTSLLVPVLDSEEEVDVAVDEERRTYSYRSPARPGRVITRPLADITLYALRIDPWMDAIADLFEREPAHRTRRREVVAGHLWHLGDLRVGRTHQFAPLYVARRLAQCPADWRRTLSDAARLGQGIVLTAAGVETDLPNRHQLRDLASLLIADGGRIAYDRALLERLLRAGPTEGTNPHEWFDERSGTLKLAEMAAPRAFRGKQKAVIAAFWKARAMECLKWSDVVTATNCGKDPDSVFGKGIWREWLERADYGRYRLRTHRQAR